MTGPRARAELLERSMNDGLALMRVGWDGGRPTWKAMGCNLTWGPQIIRPCITHTGARFAAWRRRKGWVLWL